MEHDGHGHLAMFRHITPRPVAWTRWPSSSTLGIISGGTSDLFTDALSFGTSAACFLDAYAARHAYALYVERHLERWNMTRKAAWAKIPLLVILLQSQPTLPILVWIDSMSSC